MTLAPFVISFIGWVIVWLHGSRSKGASQHFAHFRWPQPREPWKHLVNYRSTMAKNELLERVRELVEVLQITSE
jgi:hypothetical protein